MRTQQLFHLQKALVLHSSSGDGGEAGGGGIDQVLPACVEHTCAFSAALTTAVYVPQRTANVERSVLLEAFFDLRRMTGQFNEADGQFSSPFYFRVFPHHTTSHTTRR